MTKKTTNKKGFTYKGHYVSVLNGGWYAVSVGSIPPFFNKSKTVVKKFIDKYSSKK